MTDDALEALLDFLRRERGFDFTGYKRPSLGRRVRHRMTEVGIESMEEYHDFLEAHPAEFEGLFDTMLVNVTSFFRDPDGWRYLEHTVVPAILSAKGPNQGIRIWSAGCASGEEAYSLAMAFHEVMGTDQFRDRVKIYGTDVDEDAIGVARRGEYSSRQLSGVSAERVNRYFEPASGSRRVFRPDLRRCVVFGRHDLTADTPISRVDLLACRNTLIYLNTETQAEVIARFHFALAPQGFLFLGKSEALVRYTELFAPVDARFRLFQRRASSAEVTPLRPTTQSIKDARWPPALLERGDHLVHLAEALVDKDERLISANAACEALFGLSPAEIGRTVDEIGLFRVPVDVRQAVRMALTERRTSSASDVEWDVPPGGPRRFDVRVAPLADADGAVAAVSVSFLDMTRTVALEMEASEAKESLATALAELQTANEELETTNEELQSTNEELETTNEELQSTNEELETMNEEFQAASDQLDTINKELRSRSSKLDEVNSFLESVLGSVVFGVVVLDPRLVVVSWNRAVEDLWGLWASEVVGRPFFGLDIGLPVEQLRAALVACLDGGSEREELSLPGTNRRGRQIECRIAMTPLNGREGERNGVVLLMEDATTAVGAS